ncbi:hypothetical protein [Sphingosinicella microcystinivorans]|uniref:Uncharacterized protein n=1 Tax=Sphingosinicella microcystinivorans TaxID=335406 RepID=A0AAD1D8L7_SPHMI|nr:hypothetical protein [Sphingosinicella microcystinivorans]RKS94306.1 hypothetical protein DFR51_0012 [Sphingosinicella microcystinivorans]BBE35274.1 hypothetical protein SmB9_29320 [Sphingosinicella microcystinivorans]
MVNVTRSIDIERARPTRFPRFEIHADRCPQAFARVVDLLAARSLLPSELHARQSCTGLWIGLHLDIDRHAAERLAAKLRAIVSVDVVILIHAPTPPVEAGATGGDAPDLCASRCQTDPAERRAHQSAE